MKKKLSKAETAEEARQRGNDLYKSNRINDGTHSGLEFFSP